MRRGGRDYWYRARSAAAGIHELVFNLLRKLKETRSPFQSANFGWIVGALLNRVRSVLARRWNSRAWWSLLGRGSSSEEYT